MERGGRGSRGESCGLTAWGGREASWGRQAIAGGGEGGLGPGAERRNVWGDSAEPDPALLRRSGEN